MKMHRVLVLGLVLSGYGAVAQIGPALSAPALLDSETLPASPDSESASSSIASTDLPDAPSSIAARQESVVVAGKESLRARGKDKDSCNFIAALGAIYFDPAKVGENRPRCSELVYPYQRFLTTNIAIPLNWKQKGLLAAHYTTDPASLGTTIGISAINIAADSHTAYGPGWKGFGGLAGVSLLQNATAEFFGTFAVPALTHQDPRYYRMPHKPIRKRILYAITRSYVSRSDSGRPMPNYGVFAAYPFVAEIGNLYIPGIQSDGPSTAERILTGYALDPANNLVNEFLPDVAKHVHVRIIFVQQILNNIAVSGNGMM
ncbi:hypothetical protein [Edaphobacter sp. 12200R-103]|uniref:hypothetical protein n=1 Tax=Edaphobacter sp. 12200R-103 TaxID=2703788 RepID=UPI00138CDC31|nr:hypothetical protein [Edaphobacter sp. 12200R-103]QHS52336.1 hypothetical protein GWR55_11825 [Edaphobacter sp. 12200R-103]